MITAEERSLTFRLAARESLTARETARMFDLMNEVYDAVTPAQFEADLSWKSHVLLLEDADGTVQGFTTLARNPRGTAAPGCDILYSGDTVIAPALWGTQELVRGFCFVAGQMLAAGGGRKLYWYLLSKGHRTYLYLPLFFHSYFPREVAEPGLARLAAECSVKLFPDFWRPDLGVLKFPESHGQLKARQAEASLLRHNSPRVEFFLRCNPGFASGDELVCMTELHPQNMKRAARFWMERGMAAGGLP